MVDSNTIVTLLVALYAGFFWWAFRALPREGWQILAAVPRTKLTDGRWAGTNLTYYGAFTASAVVLSVALAIILLVSVAVPVHMILILSVIMLALCLPASKLLARAVEGKLNTFTVGGASMLGLFLLPLIVAGMNLLLKKAGQAPVPVMPVLAGVSVAYAFGEGTGRLACLSFGCCYGRPLTKSRPWLSALFSRHHAVFEGVTKKAVYESGLETVPLVPVQALTAAISVCAGVIGLWLFCRGHMTASFMNTIAVTQLWRVGSECFRADYRGDGRLSWYQMFAATGLIYASFLSVWLNEGPIGPPDLISGLQSLWNPGIILSLQALWLGTFVFTGRSRVTASIVSMMVLKDRI